MHDLQNPLTVDPLGDNLSIEVVKAILEQEEASIEAISAGLGLDLEIRHRLLVARRGLVARRELAAIEAAPVRRRAPVFSVRQVTSASRCACGRGNVKERACNDTSICRLCCDECAC